MSDQENKEVSRAVGYVKALVQKVCDAGMPPDVADELTRSMTIIEEEARKAVTMPTISMSGVALRKARELADDGFTVCGFTLEKDGQSSAVMFDSAVRWLTAEERKTLMFTQGSRATKGPAPEVEQLPEGGMSDGALHVLVSRTMSSAQGSGKDVQEAQLLDLARAVRVMVYKAGPVAGLKRAGQMVERLLRLLQEAEAQGFGKVTVALVRTTIAPFLPLSDQDFKSATDPNLLAAAQAVVEAAGGDYLSSAQIDELSRRCEEAVQSQSRAAAALSAQDVNALLEQAMASDNHDTRQVLLSTAEKIARAIGDAYADRLVDSVRRSIDFKAAGPLQAEAVGSDFVRATS